MQPTIELHHKDTKKPTPQSKVGKNGHNTA